MAKIKRETHKLITSKKSREPENNITVSNRDKKEKKKKRTCAILLQSIAEWRSNNDEGRGKR